MQPPERKRRFLSGPVQATGLPPGDQPWLAREDWAAGRIKSSNVAATKFLALMGVAVCGLGGVLAATVLPKELRPGNYGVLLVLLFPLAGLGLLVAAARAARARRRFGDCVFEMAAIPGALGGTLQGVIQTGARLRPAQGIHVNLSCLRRVTTGTGKSRSRQEHVLWQDEQVLTAEAGLPEPEPGHTAIPVHFQLPADQPESTVGYGDGIHWRLTASAKMPGLNFDTAFIVPVFAVAGAASAEADEPDPTATLQMPAEELRRYEHSRIRVSEGPHGREFYFPSARNLGSTLCVTFYLAVWAALSWWLWRHEDLPLGPRLILGVLGAVLAAICLTGWFKSSRVTIDCAGVRVTTRLLFFGRTRQFAAAEVSHFEIAPGMRFGKTTYTNLKLIRSDVVPSAATNPEATSDSQPVDQSVAAQVPLAGPAGVTVASAIADVAEAKWLAAEMNRALGRE
jgi:hypothetical protein